MNKPADKLTDAAT